jgi:hypothetical protein
MTQGQQEELTRIAQRWHQYAPHVQKRKGQADTASLMGRIAYRDIAFLMALLTTELEKAA